MLAVDIEHQLAGVFAEYEILPDIIQPAIEKFQENGIAEAQRDWPILTGISHDAWQSNVTITGDEITITFENYARSLPHTRTGKGGDRSYAAHIRRRGQGELVWGEKHSNIVNMVLPIFMEECLQLILDTVEG